MQVNLGINLIKWCKLSSYAVVPIKEVELASFTEVNSKIFLIKLNFTIHNHKIYHLFSKNTFVKKDSQKVFENKSLAEKAQFLLHNKTILIILLFKFKLKQNINVFDV